MVTRKIALVTGGSRGLGKETALCLAKKGIDVVLTFHTNETAASKVVKEIEAMGQKGLALQLDTSDTKGFEAFFQTLSTQLFQHFNASKFDFLVNNAGTGIYKPFIETSESDFDEMMNIHLKGVYFLTQHALNHMNDSGRIINVSSGLARFTFPNSSAYASMKGAVEVFTRYLAKELGSRRITANIVAPGAVATDFGGGENKTNEQKRKVVASLTALGRVGEPDDIGGVVAFLCSDEAKWINGQRIEVAGGIML